MAGEIGITKATMCFIAMTSSVFMSISPLPFIWRLVKNKDPEEFWPYPFIASYVSHLLWFAYCLNCLSEGKENLTLATSCLLFCSLVGLTFNAIYTITILVISKGGWITFTLLFINLLVSLLPFELLAIWINLHDPAKKVLLGTLGVVSGTLMNASPIFNITRVYKTKTSKYIPRIQCITMFLNSICWFTANCIIGSFDTYIAVTNGIGILSGFVILGILYKFRETSPKSHVLKRLEATLDADPREEIVVLNRICPRCDYIMFEKKERIKFLPDTKYVLYQHQNEESKQWRVNAVATTTERLESYTGISNRFDQSLADQV